MTMIIVSMGKCISLSESILQSLQYLQYRVYSTEYQVPVNSS